MKRISAFILSLVMLSLVLTGCEGGTKKLKIGAAGLGGGYHEFCDTLANIMNTEDSKLKLEVKTTAGSAANLRLISDDYVQFAIAQADMINDAYFGEGSYSDNSYQGYGAVAALYTEACQIVVRADSGITSVDDLQGKKICIGEEESGTEQNALQILSVSGLNESLIETVNLNYSDAAAALESGEIDAFFCTAGVKTTMIDELSKLCDIRLLSLDQKCIDKLLTAYGFFTEYEIPSGTYTGQTEAVKTVGVKAVLLASDKVDADTVESVTKLIFDNEQKLQYSVPLNIEIDANSAVEGITIPFHKGAESYYESVGVSVNDSTEKGGEG